MDEFWYTILHRFVWDFCSIFVSRSFGPPPLISWSRRPAIGDNGRCRAVVVSGSADVQPIVVEDELVTLERLRHAGHAHVTALHRLHHVVERR